jgi:hypothetical protein
MKLIKLSTLIICLLIFFSCTNKKIESNKNIHSSVNQSFSDLNKLDTFKIDLEGTKPNEMVLLFKIINHEGKEIYNAKIKGTDVIADTDPNLDLTKEKTQIAFLKTITDEFFGDDDFLEPAVMPDDVADNNVPDKAFYEQLKKTGLNGFKYRIGKEKNFYIAWDDLNKKVKVYYSCC